jgi:hypothetical protein
MTRQEANQIWTELLDYYAPGKQNEGLNAQGLGGVSLRGRELYAEFIQATGGLDLRAFVCPWPGKYEPAEFERLRALAASGGETGGGQLEYLPESHGLFLKLHYDDPPELGAFLGSLDLLVQAADHWDTDLVDLVFLAS